MRRLLILLVALVAGGSAAWFASQDTTPVVVVAPDPVPAMEMAAVLVAAQDLSRGDPVASSALIWQQWPADAVPANAVERKTRPQAIREFAGQFPNRPIVAGEPITALALSPDAHGFLAATLAPGKRAVAINVNAESTAGGFILPNDRVDVLHTVILSGLRDDAKARSSTILRNVLVLAVDQTREDTETGTVLGKTATLELTEEQVEAVTAAASSGTLSLSLRPLVASPGETSMELTKPAATIRVRRGTTIDEVGIN